MQVQVGIGSTIEGREGLALRVESDVARALARFAPFITRVEVHLAVEQEPGRGIRCTLEPRLSGRRPTSVVHVAATVEAAVAGAAAELLMQLEAGITIEDRRQHGTSVPG